MEFLYRQYELVSAPSIHARCKPSCKNDFAEGAANIIGRVPIAYDVYQIFNIDAALMGNSRGSRGCEPRSNFVH